MTQDQNKAATTTEALNCVRDMALHSSSKTCTARGKGGTHFTAAPCAMAVSSDTGMSSADISIRRRVQRRVLDGAGLSSPSDYASYCTPGLIRGGWGMARGYNISEE